MIEPHSLVRNAKLRHSKNVCEMKNTINGSVGIVEVPVARILS